MKFLLFFHSSKMPFQIQTSHQTLLLQWCSSSSKVHLERLEKWCRTSLTCVHWLVCVKRFDISWKSWSNWSIHPYWAISINFWKANKNNISDLARGGLLPSLLYLRMHHSTTLFAMTVTTNESSQSSSSFCQYLNIFCQSCHERCFIMQVLRSMECSGKKGVSCPILLLRRY